MDKKDKKIEILNFITNYQKKNGLSPSIREIGDGVGLKSSSTVFYHLHVLKTQKRIDFRDKCARSIIIKERKK